jgi:Pyruvate/2-oxoacid:ferredoxin oxidoreductase delta subunit
MRESTKALMAKHGWRIDRAIHNYIYFVFYYPYVRFVYYLFKYLAKYLSWFKPLKPIVSMALNRYHAKILSGGDVKKIVTLNEDISATSEKNKKIVPFKYAYKILFKNPEYIAVVDCPCKKTLKAPPDTINSCLCVGSGTGAFWVDSLSEKYNARKISQQEALDMITHYRKMGYINQAFFKVATGGSTGVICNCHPDTCVSLQATKFLKKFDKNFAHGAYSGYSISHDETKCKKCGTCAPVCHFEAIAVVPEKSWSYKNENCTGCELCVEHCPEGALSLYQDPSKPLPLDIDLVKSEFVK